MEERSGGIQICWHCPEYRTGLSSAHRKTVPDGILESSGPWNESRKQEGQDSIQGLAHQEKMRFKEAVRKEGRRLRLSEPGKVRFCWVMPLGNSGHGLSELPSRQVKCYSLGSWLKRLGSSMWMFRNRRRTSVVENSLDSRSSSEFLSCMFERQSILK